MQVYDAEKVYKQMWREGINVARCFVERLMKHLVSQGAKRGEGYARQRRCYRCPIIGPCESATNADRHNQLWVSDFTYVSTWQGWQYVAFVIDTDIAE